MSAGGEELIDLLQGQGGIHGSVDYDMHRAGNHHSSQSSSQTTQTGDNSYFDAFDLSQPQIPTLLSGPSPSQANMYPPSSPVGHGFAQHVTPAQLAMVLDHTVPAPNNPYPSPISAAPDWYHNGNDFEVHHSDDAGPSHRRSNSSASHQTSTTNATSRSVPASDYSYSATDMSEGEDAEMEQAEVADGLGELSIGRAGLRGEKTWTQDDQNAVQKGGKVGPIRRSSGGAAKKADKEVDRLEHRRQINRKSAQKHRQRRKDELEILTAMVAERDSKIANLEKELAVEKAKAGQLMEFVRLKSSSGGSAHGSKGGDAEESGSEREAAAEKGGRKTRGTAKTSTAGKGKATGTVYGDGRDAGW
ncbi:uncharacterized protein MKK02DRAFT_44499 [Dioszegia hungarica]|uniref:BZIP domain-containing protein n=1 Tax=Dioszegia hungarica TaxID=4972 RepID=A0AA38LUQ9_9TREE|nr:uncharacterized protein MKK02DRAFT_44499 [Dioszegia hungarica]KAI9635803.1 hypothetical protein MKK02DRAFT_44499 [Dioszegia hungarica]